MPNPNDTIEEITLQIWMSAIDAVTSEDFRTKLGLLKEKDYLQYRENALAEARAKLEAYVEGEKLQAKIDLATHISSAKTEGLFDNGDLFIKRAPVEQAIIDEIGYEAYKATKESLPEVNFTQQQEGKKGD